MSVSGSPQQDPKGTLVQDRCMRISCARSLYAVLSRTSCARSLYVDLLCISLCQDLCIRILCKISVCGISKSKIATLPAIRAMDTHDLRRAEVIRNAALATQNHPRAVWPQNIGFVVRTPCACHVKRNPSNACQRFGDVHETLRHDFHNVPDSSQSQFGPAKWSSCPKTYTSILKRRLRNREDKNFARACAGGNIESSSILVTRPAASDHPGRARWARQPSGWTDWPGAAKATSCRTNP